MSGEILRAILTQQMRVRRWKVYTVDINVPANQPVGLNQIGSIRFENDKYFLWTNIALYSATTGGVGTFTDLDEKNWTVSLSNPATGKRYQREAFSILAYTSGSLQGMSDNPTGEYVLFEGDENLRISATRTFVSARAAVLQVVLGGIEYIP